MRLWHRDHLALWLCSLSFLLSFMVQAVDEIKPFSQLHQRVWNTEHGLPQISVVAMTQDQQGYMWLATEGGLARFDGNRFQIFNASHSILFRNPLLRTLHATNNGTLLIGSTDRLIRFHNNQFSEIMLLEQSVANITAIEETANGQIFIGAEQLLLLEEEQLTVLAAPSRPITSLLHDGETLWIGGAGYLARWSEQGFETVYEHAGAGFVITKMVMNNEGLLLATQQGLWRYMNNQIGQAPHQVHDEVLMLFQQQQQLWIATYHELFQFHGTRLISRTDLRQLPNIGWLVSAFQSRDGMLWFGSKTHGLLRFRSDATANYVVDPRSSDPYVWALWPTEQELLVGHNGGLAGFDGKQFTPKIATELLSHPVVYTLHQQQDGTLWAGTRRGLNRISADFNTVQQFPTLANIQINGIAERHDGSIWLATYEGLFQIKAAGAEPVLMNDLLGLPMARYRMIFKDNQDRLWLGSSRGAFLLENEKVTLIDDPVIQDSYISYITQLNDGRIVLGSFQNGFAIEQLPSGWQKITPEQGLPSPDVIYLLEHEKGLLISNFNGVYRLGTEILSTGKVNASIVIDDIGPESGMDGLRCCNGAGNNKGAKWRNAVYLPSLNGLVEIQLEALVDKQTSPSVLIEQLIASDLYYPTSELITLSAAQRDLAFQFTAPAYYRPKTLLFRYRLLGYETDWTEVNDRRQAFYTNLPAGDLTFEVQARFRGEGDWSEIVRQPIRIQAYWYEQFWFYVFVLVSLLSAILGLYRYRLNALEKQQIKLELMVTDRTRKLNDANQQLAILNEKLQQLSVTDALTGLHNRHYLQQMLDPMLARVRRQESPVLCVLLDLDNFKKVNDLLGHQAGDSVLQQMAAVLKVLVREADHLIRWGGEEFLIIQEQQQDPIGFLNRLLQAIADAPWLYSSELPFPISCSVGAVLYPLPENSHWSWTQTLALADLALYQVKRQGKAGWMMLTPNQPDLEPSHWLQQDVEQMDQCSAFRLDCSPNLITRSISEK